MKVRMVPVPQPAPEEFEAYLRDIEVGPYAVTSPTIIYAIGYHATGKVCLVSGKSFGHFLSFNLKDIEASVEVANKAVTGGGYFPVEIPIGE